VPRSDRALSTELPSSSEIAASLLAHRLLIVLGKGGVGKTTVSAVLALRAAGSGLRTVAAEVDKRGPLAELFELRPALEPVKVSPRLGVVLLDGRHALEEYLRLALPFRTLLDAIFSAKLYEHFVNAAPGLRELMVLGKVYYEMELRPPEQQWEATVLDAPSSGQALGLLRMPFSARHVFSGGVVGREAENIARILRDQRYTCVALVSTPDHLSIKETLDNTAALKDLNIKIGAVILNRFRPERFQPNDVRQLILRASRRGKLQSSEHIWKLALMEIKRMAQSSRALNLLMRKVSAPVLLLQAYDRLEGLSLARQLCTNLGPEAWSEERAFEAQGHSETD
jgi:anion-transporting  ArsA/GET3 family ATPase